MHTHAFEQSVRYGIWPRCLAMSRCRGFSRLVRSVQYPDHCKYLIFHRSVDPGREARKQSRLPEQSQEIVVFSVEDTFLQMNR